MAPDYPGGDLVVDLLAARGVQHIFSVSGGPLNPIYHGTLRASVRIVHTRHEAAAAFMAEGTARITRSPGVCAVTLGPGVTNTVTPALTAMRAGVPFLILGGQAPVKVLDKESIMSFDPLPVMRPVTKYAARVVDPARIEEYLDGAWRAMTSGRPGPAFLEIPVDVLGGEAPPPSSRRAKGSHLGPGLTADQVEQLARLVSDARRPLLVAGDDVLWSAADNALADAVEHLGIPFVVLKVLDKESIMSFDPLPVMRPVTKYAARVVDPARIEEYLDGAWRAMTSGRPGPAFLEIPVDVLGGEAPPPSSLRAKGSHLGPGLTADQVEQLARLVSDARRPLLVAGDDVLWSAADDALADAVEHLGIPFVVLRLARGLVDERHRCCAGVGYLGSNPPLRRTLADADLVLVVGHEFEADLGYGDPISDDAVVIQSHPDAGVVGKFLTPDLGLVAGSDVVLGALAKADPGGFDRAWCDGATDAWRDWRDRVAAEPRVRGEGIHPARLSALLEDATPAGTTFVTSHGNIDFWADPVLRVSPPARYLRAGQSGALGAEIPFGVAAKLASPASTVVVIVGDGGFAFHGLEMETALRYGAPIVVVVFDDEKWGAIALPQQRAYGTEIELDLPRRAWWKVMEAMGGYGEYVDDEADLAGALDRAFASGLPAVVQVKVPSVEAPYVAYHS